MLSNKIKEYLNEYISQEVYVQVAVAKGKNKITTTNGECKFVKKRNGDTYWDRTRTARAPFIIDALMSEAYSQWTTKRELHLGAHLLNDLDYNTPSNTTPPNCIVQPLLEVVTARDVKKGEELYISYNRN